MRISLTPRSCRTSDGTGRNGLHHAWIGGLLEHTSTLLKLADQMLPLYPQLSRDVVPLGLFIHDLDKTTELTCLSTPPKAI